MEKLHKFWRASFSTKVLAPMVGIMVLVLALTVWTVNRGITAQFQSDAARALATADAVFRNSENTLAKNLLLRLHNLRNEPRYRALLQAAHLPTLAAELNNLPAEQGVDVALFSDPKGNLLAGAKRDLLLLSTSDFDKSSRPAITRAVGGDETIDTIVVGQRLFHVISIPVFNLSSELIGALTFGSEIDDAVARDFSLMTHGQIVLLANGRVIASTLPGNDWHESLAACFKAGMDPANSAHTDQNATAGHPNTGSPRTLLLDDGHYFWVAGTFPSLGDDRRSGYLLLSSYEQPLRALHGTQQMLLLVSSLGILLGTAIIWFLVRQATLPLRQLRDSAEAVGRGDFSRRVEVASADECGELALVFNQMTEKVKFSRDALEQTVETLKTTQAQLVQSEKLSGIGEFVAGVAHELNNPLTAVMGFSEILAKGEATSEQRRCLDMIHKSALRCQRIVQSLLSFARRHAPERKLSSVNALVEATIEFLQYQLRTSNIEVVAKLDPSLPKTMLDPHQIQQVFLNIINNGRQAIEGHRPKGRITVTTERAAQNIRVRIQDDGPGIAKENLSKLFDPFFTTKEIGKGTGLGLSLCYGIVQEHGGSINVQSALGEGATFIIELPVVAGEETIGSTPASPTVPDQAEPREGLGKKVLVIDDEEAIGEMMRSALTERGYHVDVARDGESALRRLNQTSYDVALCDWKMPGMNGGQVYERIRASHPALSERMIFITGDVISERIRAFSQEHGKVCLSKPFSLADFRAAVSKAVATEAKRPGAS
ncbi:MAG: hypothetical protein C5B50_07240 [Verrucomicrobia bacterium]|nr:MAG: hypothetical protein C5B50_07240 [Verrucomicrobiota bacterium]